MNKMDENMMDDDMIEKVVGGANKVGAKSKKYRFWCTRCGHSWTKVTSAPEEVHGCPRCGWWFENLEDNGDYKKECIKYTDA